MPSSNVQVTSAMLWWATLIGIVVDSMFVIVLLRRVTTEKFRHLKWPLVVTSGIFWTAIWLFLGCVFYWDSVYGYVFPAWARWYIPPCYGLMFAAIAWLIWWAAAHLPGNPLLTYFLLGGAVGTITHIWAIYRGILDKPPMLQGVSPLSATVFPFFEFVFYWCVILTLASTIHDFRNR
jgi:hypothetical protein